MDFKRQNRTHLPTHQWREGGDPLHLLSSPQGCNSQRTQTGEQKPLQQKRRSSSNYTPWGCFARGDWRIHFQSQPSYHQRSAVFLYFYIVCWLLSCCQKYFAEGNKSGRETHQLPFAFSEGVLQLLAMKDCSYVGHKLFSLQPSGRKPAKNVFYPSAIRLKKCNDLWSMCYFLFI